MEKVMFLPMYLITYVILSGCRGGLRRPNLCGILGKCGMSFPGCDDAILNRLDDLRRRDEACNNGETLHANRGFSATNL